MTTIAYRDGVLAGDTQLMDTEAGTAGFIRKIDKVDNCLIGACGNAELVSWFLNNFQGKMFNKTQHNPHTTITSRNGEEFEGIIVSPKGKLHLIEGTLIPFEFKAEYVSIGSGSSFAKGAMAVGASAIDAVKAAIKHDRNSGGKVQWVTLNA